MFYKLLNSNLAANLILWVILLIPIIYIPGVLYSEVFSRMIIFYMATSLLVALALFTLNWIRLKYWLKQPMVWLILVWLAVTVVSTIFGANSFMSWWGSAQRMAGLITSVYVVLLILVLLTHLTKEYSLRILAVVSHVAGAVGFYGILQKLDWGIVMSMAGHGRVSASLANPVFLGSFLALTIFITLYFALASKSIAAKIWYWVLVGAQALTLLLTVSKGPILGVVVGLVVFGLVYLVATYGQKIKSLLPRLLIGLVTVVVVIGGLYFLREPLGVERIFNFSLSHPSYQSRLFIWGTVFESSKNNWLTGYGMSNINIAFEDGYRPTLGGFESGYSEAFSDRSHNVVLDQLVINGWPGVVILLLFIIWLVIAILRWTIKKTVDSREILLGAAFLGTVSGYFVQDLVGIDIASDFIFGGILLAICLFTIYQPSESPPNTSARSKPIRYIFGSVAIVVAVTLFFLWYRPAITNAMLVQKAHNIARFSPEYINTAEDIFFDVMQTRMASPYDHSLLSTVYASFVNQAANILGDRAERQLEFGVSQISKFLETEPDNLNLAMFRAYLQGRLDLIQSTNKAEALFQELFKAYPNREYPHYFWGLNLFSTQQYEKSMEQFVAMAKLSPSMGLAHFWIGVVHQITNNPELAIASYQLAVKSPSSVIGMDVDSQYLAQAAKLLTEQQYLEDAIFFQKIANDRDPGNRQTMINLAVLYRDTGQIDKAQTLAYEMLKLFPDDAQDIRKFINSL